MNIDEKLAYFCGFFAADGYLSINKIKGSVVRFCLSAKDKHILDEFSALYGNKIHEYSYPRKTKEGIVNYKTVVLSISSKSMVSFIEKGNFKHDLTEIPKNLRKHFIRGFIDGDGHVSFRKETNTFRLSFTNASESLLKQILLHLEEELEIKVKDLRLREDNTHQISYESRQARIIAWYLWRNSTIFLNRKAEVVNKLFYGGTEAENLLRIVLPEKFEVIERNGGYFFRLTNAKDSKIAAHIVLAAFRQINIELSMITYGKGQEKYYGIYVPAKYLDQLVYMQSLSKITKLKGKVKLESEGIVHSSDLLSVS